MVQRSPCVFWGKFDEFKQLKQQKKKMPLKTLRIVWYRRLAQLIMLDFLVSMFSATTFRHFSATCVWRFSVFLSSIVLLCVRGFLCDATCPVAASHYIYVLVNGNVLVTEHIWSVFYTLLSHLMNVRAFREQLITFQLPIVQVTRCHQLLFNKWNHWRNSTEGSFLQILATVISTFRNPFLNSSKHIIHLFLHSATLFTWKI